MLQMDSISVRGKSSELETTQELHLLEQFEPQKTNPYSSVPSKWIQDENNLTHGWYVNTSLLHSQGYGRGEQRITHCWLPKKSYQPLPIPSQNQIFSPQQIQKTRSTKFSKKQVWVLKSSDQNAKTHGHSKSNATSPLHKPITTWVPIQSNFESPMGWKKHSFHMVAQAQTCSKTPSSYHCIACIYR